MTHLKAKVLAYNKILDAYTFAEKHLREEKSDYYFGHANDIFWRLAEQAGMTYEGHRRVKHILKMCPL